MLTQTSRARTRPGRAGAVRRARPYGLATRAPPEQAWPIICRIAGWKPSSRSISRGPTRSAAIVCCTRSFGAPGTRRRGQAAGGWLPTGQAVAASSGPISRLRLGSGLGAIDMTWTGPAPGRRRQTQARGAAHQGGDDGGPSAAPRMRRNTVAGQHVIFPKKTRGTDDADHRSPSPASCEQRSRSRKTSSFHLVRSPGLPAARRTVEA